MVTARSDICGACGAAGTADCGGDGFGGCNGGEGCEISAPTCGARTAPCGTAAVSCDAPDAAHGVPPPAYVYMVECADGTLYTGWTTDVARRVAAHNAGRGAKYTRTRLPVRLRYARQCADKRCAMQQEWALKQLTRAQKLALAASFAANR